MLCDMTHKTALPSKSARIHINWMCQTLGQTLYNYITICHFCRLVDWKSRNAASAVV